jgi:nicotinic acid mononucleotide adenylyltransferase
MVFIFGSHATPVHLYHGEILRQLLSLQLSVQLFFLVRYSPPEDNKFVRRSYGDEARQPTWNELKH